MLSDHRTDELIRQALAAEADRAPTATSVWPAVMQTGDTAKPNATARQGSPNRRRGVVAAVLVAATVILLGLDLLVPLDSMQAPPSAATQGAPTQGASPPSQVPAHTSGAASGGGSCCPSTPATGALSGLLARYLPTWLPAGWARADTPVYHASSAAAGWVSWMRPGGMPNFAWGLTLTIGAAPQLTTVTTQVGPLRQVDVCGVAGTLRVATEKVGGANTTLYDDDLWWSPSPGWVVTVSMTRQPVDTAADLARIAGSVVTCDATVMATARRTVPPGLTLLHG